MARKRISIVLIVFGAAMLAGAQDEPPTLKLTLHECAEVALGRNLSLKIERFNVDIASTFIEEESSVFDHVFSAGLERQDIETPNTNPLTSGFSTDQGTPSNDPVLIDLLTNSRMTLSEFMDYFDFFDQLQPGGDVEITEYSEEHNSMQTGISKRFPWGTQYQLELDLDRHETSSPFEGLNPAADTTLRFLITQPLLKNFGPDANLVSVRLSENNREISKTELRARILQVMGNVVEAYWTMILCQEQLDIQEESLQLAMDLLKNNTARVDAGVMAPIEILSASSGVAARQEGVIVAKNALEDAEDNLKRVLELRDGTELWDIHIVPADRPLYLPTRVDLDSSLKTARDNLPVLKTLALSIDNADLSVKAAKNQLRPQLDLSMGAWSSGLGDHADDSLDLMKDGDFTSYTVGLTLTYPLGNRAARARMQRSELQAEAARTGLEDQLRGVDLQVRAAIRQIETNQQRVDATTISVDLAEERLRAEEEALQVGLSTSHDVLDYQEDLTIARGSYTQSVIDHILSIAQLELSKGTLTQWLGFKVEE